MGCDCSYIKDNYEMNRDNLLFDYVGWSEHKMSTNPKLLRNIILIQSFIRGLLTRKKLKSLDLKNNSLFDKYPPLTDGILVTLPFVKYDNK